MRVRQLSSSSFLSLTPQACVVLARGVRQGAVKGNGFTSYKPNVDLTVYTSAANPRIDAVAALVGIESVAVRRFQLFLCTSFQRHRYTTAPDISAAACLINSSISCIHI